MHLLDLGPGRGIDRILNEKARLPQRPHPQLVLPIALAVINCLAKWHRVLLVALLGFNGCRPSHLPSLPPPLGLRATGAAATTTAAEAPRIPRRGWPLFVGPRCWQRGPSSARPVLPALARHVDGTLRPVVASQELANGISSIWCHCLAGSQLLIPWHQRHRCGVMRLNRWARANTRAPATTPASAAGALRRRDTHEARRALFARQEGGWL
mmetsp:Transcript_1079/g.2405  ORF Transcript_1079/g.2405 Transcript_1079/m.2405 type:complete len:211 (+) Transcript_1079:404-1036(+)